MPRSITAVFYALVIGAATITACGPRKAEVRTAPTAASQVTVEVQNKLSQGVNVYVVQGGTKTFLRQVNANSTVQVPVQGIATGTTVNLEATTIDGVRTYNRSNVTLTGTVVFPLP
jgi:queuine/archaeosine tRNA-ribosyltransferase